MAPNGWMAKDYIARQQKITVLDEGGITKHTYTSLRLALGLLHARQCLLG